MARVLSIEIGDSLTEICELDDHSKNPRVYRKLMISTPEGAIDDGMLQSCDGFAASLTEILRKKGIKTRKVIFSVSSGRIASREIEIPFVKQNQIYDLLKANATDYFPVDMTEYQLAYFILDVFEREGRKFYRLNALAAPKELLESYQNFAKSCGLELQKVDYAGNSVYQAFRKECAEGNQMIVKIDENSAMVAILRNGVQVLSRTVPYGIREAVEIVTQSGIYKENTSYLEAISYLRGVRCVQRSFEESQENPVQESEPDSMAPLRAEVTASFENLITGISNVLDLYYAKNSGQVLGRIILTGIGGTVQGLSQLLSSALDIPAESAEQLEGYHLERVFKSGGFAEYIGCLGAVMDPVDFFTADRKKAGGTSNVDMGRLSVTALIACAALSAVLLLVSVPPYLIARRTNRSLKTQLTQLAPVVSVYQKYTLAKQSEDFMKQAYSQAQGPTSQLVAFIEEMESKMPSDLLVTAFSSDNTTVTISINVRNKQEAADVIEQFRTFESLSTVTVTDITDTASPDDSGMVTFTVTGIYQAAADAAASASSGMSAQTDTASADASAQADTAASQTAD